MMRIVCLVAATVFAGVLQAAEGPRVTFLPSAPGTTVVRVEFPHFTAVPVARGQVALHIPGCVPLLEAGAPDVPGFPLTLSIGEEQLAWEVIEAEVEVSRWEVAPSPGNLYRDVDPRTAPRPAGRAYGAPGVWPAEPVVLRDPFLLRGVRGVTAMLHPVAYDAARGQVRFTRSLTIRFTPSGAVGANPLPEGPVPAWDPSVRDLGNRLFANGFAGSDRYDVVDEWGSILVLAPHAYDDELAPWIQWKRERGLRVDVIDVAPGTTWQTLRAIVAEAWAEEPYSFLLLAGDEDQVATELVQNGGGSGYCDPCFGYLQGDDHYPELLVGRFLAHNEAELETLVARALAYEKNPSTQDDWFSRAAGIGSNEGAGAGDEGESDWQHQNGIKADLLGFTYTAVQELYDGNQTAASPSGGPTADAAGNPTSGNLVGRINAGLSLLNYTGHGWHSGISTTGFQLTNLPSLTNTSAWPFFIIVGCCVGDFDEEEGSGDCFGEGFCKAVDPSGAPVGGIGGAFSSVLQSWAPPMEGQDEMNLLIADQGQGSIRHSLGGILFHGGASMVEAYGGAGEEMMDTWCLFGDPTLVLRTAMPTSITATHPSMLVLGTTECIVECNTEGALVALTRDGILYGRAAVSGGIAVVPFDVPLTEPGLLTVTATHFNTLPYQGFLEAVPAAGPYVLDDGAAWLDGPGGNALPESGESAAVDVAATNVGTEAALGVVGTLNCSYFGVLITDATATYGDLAVGATAAPLDGFGVALQPLAFPDGTAIPFTVTFTDADGTSWLGSFTLTVAAPVLSVSGCTLVDSDGNGRLDAGESGTLLLDVHNTGSSTATAATAALGTVTGPGTATLALSALGNVAPGGTAVLEVAVTADAGAEPGDLLQCGATVLAGAYGASGGCALELALGVEDWETGGAGFPWASSGTSPWFLTTDEAYEGEAAMQSGDIGAGGTSDLELTLDLPNWGEIRFARKVSSEEGYDFLEFSIDGNVVDAWSGEEPWEEVAYVVFGGERTFRWRYVKDEIISDGADAAWVDFVVLPEFEAASAVDEAFQTGDALQAVPNPASGPVQVLGVAAGEAVSVWDAAGRVVWRGIASGPVLTLETERWAPGVYVVGTAGGERLRLAVGGR